MWGHFTHGHPTPSQIRQLIYLHIQIHLPWLGSNPRPSVQQTGSLASTLFGRQILYFIHCLSFFQLIYMRPKYYSFPCYRKIIPFITIALKVILSLLRSYELGRHRLNRTRCDRLYCIICDKLIISTSCLRACSGLCYILLSAFCCALRSY